ncbi:hypothetical protein TD95_004516 [Thielaviopsis punctulata]|uniref:MINDY deubiquitinase domain-containing protein n=1 Tax=Thielaviopsis punctulata TaxID=72032 RepID=A0A0F4ZK15_9PEZI|nr:hypothetical protein TD95_004516 [Thielaviopsis punctulata]
MNPFIDRPVGQPANDPPVPSPAPGVFSDDISAPRSKPSISVDSLPIPILGGNPPVNPALPTTLSVQTTGVVHQRNLSETNPFKARLTAQSTGGSQSQSHSHSLNAASMEPFPQPPTVPSYFDVTPPESAKPMDPFGKLPAQTSHSTTMLSTSHDSRDSDKYIVTSSDIPPSQQPMDASIFDSWDDVSQLDKPVAPPVPSKPTQDIQADDWNLIELEPRSNSESSVPPVSVAPIKSSAQPLSTSFPGNQPSLSNASASLAAPLVSTSLQAPPKLPPRYRSPRPVDGSETYMVRQIRWQDRGKMRESPILMQNANGPCPLLALVNALIISTPKIDAGHGLASHLGKKKSVTLDKLLEAMVSELLDRERSPNSPLPDLGDMMEFLKGLHTGMNVNPRFVPTQTQANSAKRTSLSHIHPVARDALIPGGFEDSVEMRFYSTFGIPLVHGWIPESDAYTSMARSAPTYESAQVLLSREEELEEKLSTEGLTNEEDLTVLHDITTIKTFLSEWPTQLTPKGLEIITHSLMPGQVCIFFRNDHFSTLYRHPQTLELLSLVTDSGYATHDEIVWESLVDINGEQAEFFSGDFRVVSGRPSSSPVGPRTSSSNCQQSAATAHTSSSEQVDRDLALAMQLQEEEDARQRASRQAHGNTDRRHRASRNAVDGQAPAINPRGVPLQRRHMAATAPPQQSGVMQGGGNAVPYDGAASVSAYAEGSERRDRRDQYCEQNGGARPGHRNGKKSRDCIVM